MEYDYPILKRVFEHYKQNVPDLSDVRLYSCQHLLGSQLEMYKMFIAFGIKPQNIVALGKAYSSNGEVIEDLKRFGVSVDQPQFTGAAFDIEHLNNCQSVASRVQDGFRNIALDDGGYLISELKDKPIDFGVEQTSAGFRKLSGLNLSFPVYNVARSKTKLTQESPLIGRLIFERIRDYAAKAGILKPKLVLIGLGALGRSAFEIFKEEGFEIQGFDVETNKVATLAYLKQVKPDIVVGATGIQIFNKDDFKDLEGDHIYHFISVSSSDREFPVVEFRNGQGVHDEVEYKNFIFVNNGFPITFKGNKYESSAIEMEKTMALLMGSVFHGLTKKDSSAKGLIDVPKGLEELING